MKCLQPREKYFYRYVYEPHNYKEVKSHRERNGYFFHYSFIFVQIFSIEIWWEISILQHNFGDN